MAAQIDWSRNESGRDEGFVEAVTPDVARRQLRMSLGLMGVFAAAVAALAATASLPTHSAKAPVVATLTVHQPEFVRPMTAGVAVSDPRI